MLDDLFSCTDFLICLEGAGVRPEFEFSFIFREGFSLLSAELEADRAGDVTTTLGTEVEDDVKVDDLFKKAAGLELPPPPPLVESDAAVVDFLEELDLTLGRFLEDVSEEKDGFVSGTDNDLVFFSHSLTETLDSLTDSADPPLAPLEHKRPFFLTKMSLTCFELLYFLPLSLDDDVGVEEEAAVVADEAACGRASPDPVPCLDLFSGCDRAGDVETGNHIREIAFPSPSSTTGTTPRPSLPLPMLAKDSRDTGGGLAMRILMSSLVKSRLMMSGIDDEPKPPPVSLSFVDLLHSLVSNVRESSGSRFASELDGRPNGTGWEELLMKLSKFQI